MNMKKFSKELRDYYDLDKSECKELEKENLVPDHSKVAEEKYNELMKRGRPFSFNEIWFLGTMNVVDFQNYYPAEAEEYMDM